jgi:hypothetical protein
VPLVTPDSSARKISPRSSPSFLAAVNAKSSKDHRRIEIPRRSSNYTTLAPAFGFLSPLSALSAFGSLSNDTKNDGNGEKLNKNSLFFLAFRFHQQHCCLCFSEKKSQQARKKNSFVLLSRGPSVCNLIEIARLSRGSTKSPEGHEDTLKEEFFTKKTPSNWLMLS